VRYLAAVTNITNRRRSPASAPAAETGGAPGPAAAALSRSTLLAEIPHEDLRALLHGARRRSYTPGQELFHRGDDADGFYAIVSGEVRLLIEGPDGEDVALATFGAGEALGELSLLDGRPRSATAHASRKTEAIFIASSDFHAWLDARPRAARAMLAEMARRLRSTDEQLAEIALLGVEARIARRLWQLFSERAAGRAVRAGARVPLNQRDFAALIGTTRESVNRQLARLKTAGVIAVEAGNVVILDPRALQRTVEEI
jgi:CRP/FNR family transcriptional regulator/CRP/FNR family cyclic AMP-dependent transcriptional regulator